MRILTAATLAALLLSGAALPAAAQQRASQQIGSFVIFPDADPITDANRSTALSPGVDTLSFVGWQCAGDTAAMFVVMQGTAGDGDFGAIYRFDQDAPDSTVLSQSGDKDKVWMWFPEEETYALTQRALNASRLVVRWYDDDNNAVDLIFNMTATGRALRALPCVAHLRPPVLGTPERARKPASKPHG